MEGHRLILKRKIPAGRQRLVAIFAGAIMVVGLVMIAQLKTTLSAHSLAAVKKDFGAMQSQFTETASAATAPAQSGEAAGTPSTNPADTAVEKFKKLLQDTSVPAPTTPSGQ